MIEHCKHESRSRVVCVSLVACRAFDTTAGSSYFSAAVNEVCSLQLIHFLCCRDRLWLCLRFSKTQFLSMCSICMPAECVDGTEVECSGSEDLENWSEEEESVTTEEDVDQWSADDEFKVVSPAEELQIRATKVHLRQRRRKYRRRKFRPELEAIAEGIVVNVECEVVSPAKEEEVEIRAVYDAARDHEVVWPEWRNPKFCPKLPPVVEQDVVVGKRHVARRIVSFLLCHRVP